MMEQSPDEQRTPSRWSRRQLLRASAATAAAGAALPWLTPGQAAAQGSSEPFPIPWLDANLAHNQSPGMNKEPSNIYHFNGWVGRCNRLNGMGTDGQGNRIPFGGEPTDFGFMHGQYVGADRLSHFGTFVHI